jgi:hypothetical protein
MRIDTPPVGLAYCLCRHEYPQWQSQDFSNMFPDLGSAGIDLMKQMLLYDNSKRISVRLALPLPSQRLLDLHRFSNLPGH